MDQRSDLGIPVSLYCSRLRIFFCHGNTPTVKSKNFGMQSNKKWSRWRLAVLVPDEGECWV